MLMVKLLMMPQYRNHLCPHSGKMYIEAVVFIVYAMIMDLLEGGDPESSIVTLAYCLSI